MTRRGMTLIEMMVAMTATLLLMAAIAQVFSAFGSAVSDSRSVIDLDARMRAVAWRLRTDLDGATATTAPPLRPDADEGYFEIIEGVNTDTKQYFDPASGASSPAGVDKMGGRVAPSGSDDRLLGDTDDLLLFTTRSTTVPFLGRYWTGSQIAKFESTVAEVAWFLRPTTVGGTVATANPVTYTLYRRQLLVVGYVGMPPFVGNTNMLDSTVLPASGTPWQSFWNLFDLSVRAVPISGGLSFIPNTLADLTRRESRFMHNLAANTDGSGYPFDLPADLQSPGSGGPQGLIFLPGPSPWARPGDDVVLTNVIGFDVRVFDPTAETRESSGGSSVVPGDPGYGSSPSPPLGRGAYVDLGNGEQRSADSSMPRFAGTMSTVAAAAGLRYRTWDTWSTHYETNGFDEDRDGRTDEGSNGFDDDGDQIVDNGPLDLDRNTKENYAPGEQETCPPYPYPLRGIEVRLRCYEPSSRQVRQITVRHTFVGN